MSFKEKKTHHLHYPEPNLKKCCPKCGGDIYKITFRDTTYIAGIPVSSTPEEDLHFQCWACKSVFGLSQKVELYENGVKNFRQQTANQPIQILSREVKEDVVLFTYRKNNQTKKTKDDKLVVTAKVALMAYYARENEIDTKNIDFTEIYSSYADYSEEIDETKQKIQELSIDEAETYTYELLKLAQQTFARSINLSILRPTAKLSMQSGIGYNYIAKDILDFYNISELNQKSFWINLNNYI